MLAYPLPEAETLLDSKLEAAQSSLANCEEDLDFLREQITVSAAPCNRISGRTLIGMTDYGGCHGPSVQLGRGTAQEGERWRQSWR